MGRSCSRDLHFTQNNMKKIKQYSHLSNVSYQFVVSIIELLEHHWVSALVWVALQSLLPKCLRKISIISWSIWLIRSPVTFSMTFLSGSKQHWWETPSTPHSSLKRASESTRHSCTQIFLSWIILNNQAHKLLYSFLHIWNMVTEYNKYLILQQIWKYHRWTSKLNSHK